MHNQQILYIIKISRVCVYDGQLFMKLTIDVKECFGIASVVLVWKKLFYKKYF